MATTSTQRRRKPAVRYLDHQDHQQLLRSWELHLRAERKSPETLKSYLMGVRQFLAWCAEDGADDGDDLLTRARLNGFIAHLLTPIEEGGLGREAATAVARHLAVRRYSAWLLEEGETDGDELAHLRAPKLDEKVVTPLTEDELTAMLAVCSGRDFLARRDQALLRFMIECVVRAGETATVSLSRLDLREGTAVLLGKGGKERVVSFGPKCSRALDRYLRLRAKHRLADTDALWLGDRGKAFTYDALYDTLTWRAEQAGVKGFHPHRLRQHQREPVAAQGWLRGGPHGRRRLDQAGHGPALHPRRGLGPSRPRGPPPQPRRDVARSPLWTTRGRLAQHTQRPAATTHGTG